MELKQYQNKQINTTKNEQRLKQKTMKKMKQLFDILVWMANKNHEQIYFHPMQNGPKHSNVVSSGVSGVVVTDNAWPPCTANVDGSTPRTVAWSELEKNPHIQKDERYLSEIRFFFLKRGKW